MLSTVGGMNMAVVTGTDALFLQSSYGSYYRCGILIKNTGDDFYKKMGLIIMCSSCFGEEYVKSYACLGRLGFGSVESLYQTMAVPPNSQVEKQQIWV